MITILLMVFMMSIGCSRRKEVSIEPKKETKTTAEKSSSKETIYVYVCGEVKHPGVYRFSKDERIVSAVKAAGGLTKKASAESINQAEKMKDGQQITIPSKKQTAKNEGSDSKAVQSSSGKININTADAAQLMELTGIGAAKAEAVLAYREKNGSFQDIEELKKVDGIADKTFEKIKDSIKVN